MTNFYIEGKPKELRKENSGLIYKRAISSVASFFHFPKNVLEAIRFLNDLSGIDGLISHHKQRSK